MLSNRWIVTEQDAVLVGRVQLNDPTPPPNPEWIRLRQELLRRIVQREQQRRQRREMQVL
jgi:hypothetical protein